MFLERQAAEDRDAVVHALSVEDAVGVAERRESIAWENVVDDLGFLKAQYVGGFIAKELFDDAEARAHRIDVPRRDLDG